MSLSRTSRQLVVIALYTLLLVLLVTAVYWVFRAEETCYDGLRNQDEQGMDCGGVCEKMCEERVTGNDPVIKEVAYAVGGAGVVDVLGQVYNPNDEVGASSFRYRFEVKDATGNVLGVSSGESFILPRETKYVLGINVGISGTPAMVELTISDIQWERFTEYRERPTINIYQKRYDQIASGTGFGEVFGLLSNESPYDFRSIVIKVALRDADGALLALHSTEMRTVNAKERRDFRLVWPSAFPGTVAKVEMEAEADVYHSDNFIRQYLPQGKFQEIVPSRPY